MRAYTHLLLSLLESLADILPVGDIPDGFHVVGTHVLILQVICVLPHIDAKQWHETCIHKQHPSSRIRLAIRRHFAYVYMNISQLYSIIMIFQIANSTTASGFRSGHLIQTESADNVNLPSTPANYQLRH